MIPDTIAFEDRFARNNMISNPYRFEIAWTTCPNYPAKACPQKTPGMLCPCGSQRATLPGAQGLFARIRPERPHQGFASVTGAFYPADGSRLVVEVENGVGDSLLCETARSRNLAVERVRQKLHEILRGLPGVEVRIVVQGGEWIALIESKAHKKTSELHGDGDHIDAALTVADVLVKPCRLAVSCPAELVTLYYDGSDDKTIDLKVKRLADGWSKHEVRFVGVTSTPT